MPFANPKSHLIHSIREAGGTALHWLLLEAIDNSLDYHANEVVISVDSGADLITIIDNGDGITKDRIEAPITLGDHRPSASGGLGRFGVGITAQAIKHGNVLEIETVSADGAGTITARWAEMVKRGDWYYQDPVWRPVLTTTPTGTRVTIAKLLRSIKAKDIERARDEIAHRFYPALASGRRIVINGGAIPVLAEPLLSDVIQSTLTFEDGRVAKVRAGLLKDPAASALRRVNVSYLHRVIKPNSGFGCDGYSGIENLFARVELSEHWRLTQFKDDVNDSDELEERLADLLRPILEKCHARSMTLDIEETIEVVNDLLGDAAARPRAKKPASAPQPPKPKPEPKPAPFLDNADASPSGPVKKKRPRAQIKIEFPRGKHDAETYGVGTVDRSARVHRVIMPLEDPAIAEIWSERDVIKRASRIHLHVIMLYVQATQNFDLFEGYGKAISEFMKSSRLRKEVDEISQQA